MKSTKTGLAMAAIASALAPFRMMGSADSYADTRTRLCQPSGWLDAQHTRRGPGRISSYQANGWRRPGANAARKRLRKMTGANRLGL